MGCLIRKALLTLSVKFILRGMACRLLYWARSVLEGHFTVDDALEHLIRRARAERTCQSGSRDSQANR
jgi:hypothetical protein